MIRLFAPHSLTIGTRHPTVETADLDDVVEAMRKVVRGLG